jgi:hypothetical protein
MFLENEFTGIKKIKPEYITIMVCTILSIFFMNTGFLALLYLVPIGYAVIVSRLPWLTFISAAAANILLNVVIRRNGSGNMPAEIFYISILFLMFIWIMDVRKNTINIRTTYRFIIGSIAGAVAFLIFVNNRNSAFYPFIEEVAKSLSANIDSSTGIVTQSMSPDNIVETVRSFILRGGALFTMFIVFFINRQMTHTLVLMIKKQRNGKGLIEFFAPPNTLWILLGSLATLFVTRLLKIELLEILAWNVLTVCSILFLTQGAGIFLHLLSRCTNTLRLVISVVVVVFLFSPLGIIAVAALLLLGISENWRSVRAPNQ